MVTPALFKKYRDARAFAQAKPATFESEIRSTGFFRSKTKSILGACQAIVAKHDGKVPDTMEGLCALPGVGRKTANVVLGNAFSKNEGIVVDTHVIRLSQRFKLTRHKDAEKIEQDLMKIVPRQDWTLWSHWLIWHGRRRCFARKPDCANCEVFDLCPSGKVFLRTGEAKTFVAQASSGRGLYDIPVRSVIRKPTPLSVSRPDLEVALPVGELPAPTAYLSALPSPPRSPLFPTRVPMPCCASE